MEEFKVAHIADIHYRGLQRHDEYRRAFEFFFAKCKELEVDHIFIGGDVFHTKTQGISPEVIEEFSWFFRGCGDTASTSVILGNHDLNLTNLNRRDVLSPIIDAVGHPAVTLYRESGVYPISERVNLCVFSCIDEHRWSEVAPEEGAINVAAFHGSVNGSETDSGWALNGDVDISFFDGYDFAFLGDIHQCQFLDSDKRIAYPGSVIQQNYGEHADKGFLLWKIRSRDDFDVDFHGIPATKPFVTVDWSGSIGSVMETIKKLPPESRFRIRTEELIPQQEIKKLYAAIKGATTPTEIVFKNQHSFDAHAISITDDQTAVKDDLRLPETHIRLFDEFFDGNMHVSDDDKKQMALLLREYVSGFATNEVNHRNTKWSIKNLRFDNLFSYGRKNEIDFTKLSGITGIFAPNRAGKSSIVGALMYTLFNTTDRGSLKNLHIINTRKGHGRGRVILNIAGRDYYVERQSVRHTIKKTSGEHAVTHVNFGEWDAEADLPLKTGELNGLARVDTDKMIRRYIGTHDDFLMTSFASQGALNRFIEAGSAQRKQLLSRFLGLDIFDVMHERAKKEHLVISGRLRDVPEESWLPEIKRLKALRTSSERTIEVCNQQLVELRGELDELRLQLKVAVPDSVVTRADVQEQEDILARLEGYIEENRQNFDEYRSARTAHKKIITAARRALRKYDLERINADVQRLDELNGLIERKIQARKHEQHVYERMAKSISNLEGIPCGDSFPTCKFIKDSVVDKQGMSQQKLRVDEHDDEIAALTSLRNELVKDDPVAAAKEHARLSAESVQSEREVAAVNERINKLKLAKKDLTHKRRAASKKLEKLRCDVVDTVDERVTELTRQINVLKPQIARQDNERINAAKDLGHAKSELARMLDAFKKWQALRAQLRTYELFLKAVNKRGIPTLILRKLAPVINQEIAAILQGVVDFTVSIEAPEQGNAMNIFLDYGDSKRILEAGSGMEKMISSLAIRVALTNISSLPKTDLLIIDEGFGALDETNIEACSRLLVSLKRWFKNILVITHVDGIKDIADNLLEITRDEKDSKIVYI